MAWIDDALELLAAVQPCGYHRDAVPRSEPTALAAMALVEHGQYGAAAKASAYLSALQAGDGTVGLDASQNSPVWFTALAVLAWETCRRLALTSSAGATGQRSRPVSDNIDRAIAALVRLRGSVAPRTDEMGHDSTLAGWAWVEGTHSWIEPTAWSVLALSATGHGRHPRAVEARRLLVDRLLPEGGCNYGNTTVLGQELRPHVQPSGLTMVALAGDDSTDRRITATLDYLAATLDQTTTTASLCYGLLGLAAHNRRPADADRWLAAAAARTLARDRAPHKLALLLLAATPQGVPANWFAAAKSSSVARAQNIQRGRSGLALTSAPLRQGKP